MINSTKLVSEQLKECQSIEIHCDKPASTGLTFGSYTDIIIETILNICSLFLKFSTQNIGSSFLEIHFELQDNSCRILSIALLHDKSKSCDAILSFNQFKQIAII